MRALIGLIVLLFAGVVAYWGYRNAPDWVQAFCAAWLLVQIAKGVAGPMEDEA